MKPRIRYEGSWVVYYTRNSSGWVHEMRAEGFTKLCDAVWFLGWLDRLGLVTR